MASVRLLLYACARVRARETVGLPQGPQVTNLGLTLDDEQRGGYRRRTPACMAEVTPEPALRLRFKRYQHGAARRRPPRVRRTGHNVHASVVIEHLAQFARESFGLIGVSGLAAEEAAVVTREHGRRPIEQLASGDRRVSGERVQRLLADGDYNARSKTNRQGMKAPPRIAGSWISNGNSDSQSCGADRGARGSGSKGLFAS